MATLTELLGSRVPPHSLEAERAVLGALLLYFPAHDLRICVAVLLLAASHAWLDRGTHVVSLMRALRIVQRREPERWLHLATDQTLHILALALVAAWLSWGR